MLLYFAQPALAGRPIRIRGAWQMTNGAAHKSARHNFQSFCCLAFASIVFACVCARERVSVWGRASLGDGKKSITLEIWLEEWRRTSQVIHSKCSIEFFYHSVSRCIRRRQRKKYEKKKRRDNCEELSLSGVGHVSMLKYALHMAIIADVCLCVARLLCRSPSSSASLSLRTHFSTDYG